MFMIDLPLYASRLMGFAQMQGHSIGADDDFGYMTHAWLAAVLGESAPRPFRLFERRDGIHLLGYSREDIAVLRDQAQTFAEPMALNVCDWSASAGKPMPDRWTAGKRLGFEVRACPVSRGDRERDVFLVALENAREKGILPPSRPETYLSWLVQRMGAATENGGVFIGKTGSRSEPIVELPPGGVSLSGFRRVTTGRRSKKGRNVQHGIERPDALFTGILVVRDPGRFTALLERGVGRHLAFGFGMLLLRPPSIS